MKLLIVSVLFGLFGYLSHGVEIAATCESKMAKLYLSGHFLMPGTAEPVHLFVGKQTSQPASDPSVWAILAKPGAQGCEAVCRVSRFERYKKDQEPAIMEVECPDSAPTRLVLVWDRSSDQGIAASVQLPSRVYGLERAKLSLEIDRYQIARNAPGGILARQARQKISAPQNVSGVRK